MKSGCDSPSGRTRKHLFPEPPATSEPIGPSSPTTFFLRRERDMRRTSHSETAGPSQQETSSKAGRLEESCFGVQSLEDTLGEAFSQHTMPPQPNAGESRASAGRPLSANTKRNPVHPKISATAQRIISSGCSSSRTSSASSTNMSLSPLRRHMRGASRASCDSSFISLHQSPMLGSGIASTPRSGSVRSLGLSDEEGSMLDDCGSQAIHSGSEDEDDEHEEVTDKSDHVPACVEPVGNGPQLVMPSLSMPKRRPFTQRGMNMGRLKVLVMGPSRVGKTSLIRSIMQTCDDIVHVDPSTTTSTVSSHDWLSDTAHDRQTYLQTNEINEINASTKAYPRWWSEIDESRGLKRRRSIGGPVLDRNICFVDTPGWDNTGRDEHEHMQLVVDDIVAYLEESLRRNASMSQLGDSDVLDILSGGGGVQVDAILYIFHPARIHVTPTEIDVLRRLSSFTNIIPIIGKSDTCSEDHIRDASAGLRATLESANIKPFTFHNASLSSPSAGEKAHRMPYAISSAVGDDSEVMDASLLMSSGYARPLRSSELPELINQLFEPDNIQWLRHCAVKKFLYWRRENHGTSIQSHKDEINALPLDYPNSIFEDEASDRQDYDMDWSMLSKRGTVCGSDFEFNDYIDISRTRSPVHVAGWAHDLQHALEVERCRFLKPQNARQMARQGMQADGTLCKRQGRRITKNELRKGLMDNQFGVATCIGAAVSSQDPLGVLALEEAFNKRGWQMIRVVGGCSVFATVAVWLLRNWSVVAESVGFAPEAHHHHHLAGYALLGPKDAYWKDLLWGDRW